MEQTKNLIIRCLITREESQRQYEQGKSRYTCPHCKADFDFDSEDATLPTKTLFAHSIHVN